MIYIALNGYIRRKDSDQNCKHYINKLENIKSNGNKREKYRNRRKLLI